MAKKKHLLNEVDEDDIKQAIMNAELDTSAEIRVHVEDVCVGDPKIRAAKVFDRLGMQKTELRNGVLFYIAVSSLKFAIICDTGINTNERVFWPSINQLIMNSLRDGKHIEGLVEAITLTGEYLKKTFPFHREVENELPDDISY